MDGIRSFFYRCFQVGVYIVSWFLPWREPKLFKGEDALSQLATFLLKKKKTKICIVTDKGIKEIGILRLLLNALEDVNIECFVYDKTVPNPTEQNAQEACDIYKENFCTAFIAIGGGSSIDCAKIAAALAAKPTKKPIQMKGILRVLKRLPFVFAVPTTAGSGSETTLAAVVTESEAHEKYAIKDPALIPYGAVLDPKLTIGLPPSITATTGLDALTHAVEAFIGRNNTNKTKKCALTAIKIIFENLPLAYKDGANITARENMQQAAYLAGIAFTRAYVGYAHAIGHTLGAFYGIPHGLAVSVSLPYVLNQYGEEAHKKLAILADHIGISQESDAVEMKAQKFIEAISTLYSTIHVQNNIPEIKVEDIPNLSKTALKEGNPEYPVPRIMFQDEFEDLFEQIRTGASINSF